MSPQNLVGESQSMRIDTLPHWTRICGLGTDGERGHDRVRSQGPSGISLLSEQLTRMAHKGPRHRRDIIKCAVRWYTGATQGGLWGHGATGEAVRALQVSDVEYPDVNALGPGPARTRSVPVTYSRA
jgi:hypothetical protein